MKPGNLRLCALVGTLAALTPLTARQAWADCKDPFGKPDEVLDFHVKMSRADWIKLRDSSVPNVDGMPPNSPACMADFPEFPAEFRCGDEPWIKIGIRKKRGTERGTEVLEKPPLKIDFNEDFMGMQPTAKGQRWPANMGPLGYRKLTLNNGQGNKPEGRTLILPLLMTEHVALRLLKREVATAPGTAYARITLHTEDKPAGEYHGVYILIEDIDRTALERRFGRGDGRLTKMSRDNCSPVAEFDDGAPNTVYPAFMAWMNMTPGTGAAWLDQTSKVFDLDALLRQEAIREILVNGDDTISYVTTSPQMREGNNFFAYDPREGKRHYMPWDVDLTFGQQNGNCAPTPLMCAENTAILKYCPMTESRIGRGTVCNPAIQRRYLEIMCQLTNGSMSAAEILKIWESANTAVRPWAGMEKDVVWGGKDPLDVNTAKTFGAEYVRLKNWIPGRIRSVQQQIAAKGVACAAGCTAGAKEACESLGCPGERKCENGLWTPCVAPVCRAPASDGGVPMTPGDGGASDASSSGQGGAMNTGSGGAPGGMAGSPGSGNTGGSAGAMGANGGSSGSSTGGRSGTGGSATTRSGGASGGNPPAGGSGGGGCAVANPAKSGDASAALGALGLLVLGLARRRRNRRGRGRDLSSAAFSRRCSQ
ncbi:MAG TPA: CotH kinase family protein [Polyangia bacterium]